MRLLSVILLTACASSPTAKMAEVRPIDEDQLAILPAGADAVLDVDMEQLRTWAPAHRFFSLIPADARANLQKMSIDPWMDLDGIVLTLNGVGTPQQTTTMLLRGDLEAEKIAEGAPLGEYRQLKIWETPERAIAKLSPRMIAMGTPAEVRRVIDLIRGVGESVRSADRDLVSAFARAPSAKSGRPAVIGAAVPSEPMRQQLKTDQLPGSEYQFLTFVLAVGDGFDFEIIGKTRSLNEAASLTAGARASLDQLRARPAVRLLGLLPYLEDIVIVDRQEEVRMVYRLAERRVDKMLARLEQLAQLRK